MADNTNLDKLDMSLQLADGTETDVQQDTRIANLQGDPTPRFKFSKGNYETFDNFQNEILNKITTVRQTVLPILTAAMIELLGEDSTIKYDSFDAKYDTQNGNFVIIIDILVSTVLWIGTDISKEAVNHDAQYVLDRLRIVPNINWQNCIIDTNNGTLNLRFSL